MAAADPGIAGVGKDLSVVAIAGRGRSAGYVVFASGAPRLFLKTAPVDDSGDLHEEHRRLRAASDASGLDGTVPRHLGLHEIDGRLVLAQEALPGRSLLTLLRSRRRTSARAGRADLRALSSWTARLASSDPFGPAAPGAPAAEALASHPRWGALAAHPAARGLLRSLGDGRERELMSSVHGDLWPGNVVVRRGAIGIVDWQHGGLGRPTDDLFFLLFAYAHAHPWGRWHWASPTEAFDRAFTAASGGWLAAVGAALVRERLASTGLDPDSAEARLLLFALERSAATGPGVGPGDTDWLALARRVLDLSGRTALSAAGG